MSSPSTDKAKIYLALCLVALFIEGAVIVVRPMLGRLPEGMAKCVRCSSGLIPGEARAVDDLCSSCIDIARRQLTSTCPRCNLLQRGNVGDFCFQCTDQIARRLGVALDDAGPYMVPYPVDPSDPAVVLVTDRGRITIELFKKKAPQSVENFLRYVRDRRYEGAVVHRIETYLVVLGLWRDPAMAGQATTPPGYALALGGSYGNAPLVRVPVNPPVVSESGNGLEHRIGTIGYPRYDEDPNSATSDFFVNFTENKHYNKRGTAAKEAGYTVFAQVLEGMEILLALRREPVLGPDAPKGYERMPRRPIRILRALEATINPQQGATAPISSPVYGGR